MFTIKKLAICSLSELPEGEGFRGDFDPEGKDYDLCRDVELNGVLVPVLVDRHYRILKGRRRVLAASEAGHTHVMCVVRTHDSLVSTRSYRMQRVPSVYVKCVDYRSAISNFVSRGRAVPDSDWFRLEQITGERKATLVAGIGVLDYAQKLVDSGQRELIAKGLRVEQTFRDRGLACVLRMIDRKVKGFENVEPDCSAWLDGDVGGPTTPELTTRYAGAE